MIPSIQSNDRQTPIEHKYREGNVKRTLGMELTVHQIDKLRKCLDFLRNSLFRQPNLETLIFPKCLEFWKFLKGSSRPVLKHGPRRLSLLQV